MPSREAQVEHEEAASRLSDLVFERLDPDSATQVEAHAESCSECREVMDLMRQLHTEAALHGSILFAEHPRSEDLVKFATADDELSTNALAQIANHVRTCADCTEEAALVRDAMASTDAWWRKLLSPLLYPGRGGASLIPKLAVLLSPRRGRASLIPKSAVL